MNVVLQTFHGEEAFTALSRFTGTPPVIAYLKAQVPDSSPFYAALNAAATNSSKVSAEGMQTDIEAK